MHYHNVIIQLYTRLVSSSDNEEDSGEAVQLSEIGSTSMMADDSRVNLETVLRLAFLRHGFDCWDVFLVQSLALLAYASLEKMATANSASSRVEAVSTLAFCVSNSRRSRS